MVEKTPTQTAKDRLVIATWLTGLVFLVVLIAYLLSLILLGPHAEPKPGPAAGAQVASAQPPATQPSPVQPASVQAGSAPAQEGGAAPSATPVEADRKPNRSDLIDLFSGASSLALIMFSLLLALAAIIGWQSLRLDVEAIKAKAEGVLETTATSIVESARTKSDLISKVTEIESGLRSTIAGMEATVAALQAELKDKTEKAGRESRGRVDAVMGAMIGILHSKPYQDAVNPEERDFLVEAIQHIKAGYKRLKDLEGKGKYMAMNNLAYFTCLLGDKAAADEMLEFGRELLREGRENEHQSSGVPYLLTYCRIVLVYNSNREAIDQAIAIARKLAGGLTKLQKREADYLVASLLSKLGDQRAEPAS